MPRGPNPSKRYLPHAVLATFLVMAPPALAVSAIETSGRPWLVLTSMLLAIGLSVSAASVGSAIWMRRPGSRDLVFGDLMLWGWLRRVRAERRLAEARELLGSDASEVEGQQLSRARRCEILQQLGALLEARDAYTHGHTRRVTRHTERIAREMALSPEEVAKVRTAAALHDVGKVHTPREVLTKAGRLTDEEFAVIKRHPVDGAEMVAEIGDPEITAMVRHHHERLDGTGYPDGLTRDGIPLGARIISVADTFDAMTSSRPYRGACKHKKALDVLSEEAGSQLDPDAVAAFRRYYSGKGPVAWSAFVVTTPQRLAGWIGGLFQGLGAGVAPLAQGITAIGVAALVGASLGDPAAPATAVVETAAHHSARQDGGSTSAAASTSAAGQKASERAKRGSEPDRDPQGGSGGPPGGGAKGAPTGSDTPATGGNGEPSRRDPSGGGSQGESPSQGGSGPKGGLPTDEGPSAVPNVDVPTVEVPNVEVPKVELPNLQLPDVNPLRLP
jgi:putative nucleotidyltransferase with HDIG domain